MKRILAVTLPMSAALTVATIAGVSPSLAARTCGSGTGCASASPAASPAYLSVPGRLYAAAGRSARDIWAVGLMPNSSLIMHWNGRSWAVSYDKPLGYFYNVRATSARDVWAVGGTNWFSPSQTLAEHWNGKSWNRVATPTPGGSAYFTGAAATSIRNAWAVGLIGPGPGIPSFPQPLIEHWNGRAWSVQRFAEPAAGGEFSAVGALSRKDAWAVGWTGGSSEGSGQTTLIEHWNGRTWKRVPSPDPAGTANTLSDVTALSRDDAWAVGYTASSGGQFKSLTLHWNGRAWRVVRSPNPTGDTNLWRVVAVSRDDVWVVGYTNPTTCGPQCATIAMHWNGRTWHATPTPDAPGSNLNAFLGVVAVSSRNVWAVGTTDWSRTLIAHWNGKAWS